MEVRKETIEWLVKSVKADLEEMLADDTYNCTPTPTKWASQRRWGDAVTDKQQINYGLLTTHQIKEASDYGIKWVPSKRKFILPHGLAESTLRVVLRRRKQNRVRAIATARGEDATRAVRAALEARATKVMRNAIRIVDGADADTKDDEDDGNDTEGTADEHAGNTDNDSDDESI
jgi:hypothetical protein